MDNKNRQGQESDRFRDIFKYYKRRQPPPDFTRAIDVDTLSEVRVVPPPEPYEWDKTATQATGLNPPHTWIIHSLIKHPGLLVVRNPFTRTGQLAWVKRCLREIPVASNKTNLAAHGIQLRDKTWWQLCLTSEGVRSGLKHKLRWVTLGYHHNWDTKEYSEEERGEMPEALLGLCGVVAQVLALGDFRAQAAIINYYHLHSTLSPHTDHSEPCTDAPLFSFSFGQSAVFLIGGTSKATEPSAVMLHSGDIVVMGGAARLCYHAVPRILTRGEWKKVRRKGKEAEKMEEEEEEEPWATEGENRDGRIQERKKKGENEHQEWKRRWKAEEKQDKPEEEESDDDNQENQTQHQQAETAEQKQHNYGRKTQTALSRKESCHLVEDDGGDEGDEDLPNILEYIRTCRINMNVRQVLPPTTDKLPS